MEPHLFRFFLEKIVKLKEKKIRSCDSNILEHHFELNTLNHLLDVLDRKVAI